ncbi:MAG: hypothetical protein M1834_005361 [Cirrosporium novae-zelandiae]|nr:MAG: hypothetical protein M1834_005361 [Cirrosporium novae-zelandiae]
MSKSYNPDNDSVPTGVWSSVALSQRDLAGQVPINFATRPAVSLSAACFGQGKYDDEGATTCLSNLIALGFRKLEADVFWDTGKQAWGFCPLSSPTSAESSQSSFTTSLSSLASMSLSSVILHDSTSNELMARSQLSSSAFSTSKTTVLTSTLVDTNSSATESPQPTSTLVLTSNSSTVYGISDYNCTTTVDMSILTSVLQSYFQLTADTVHASVLYLTLNMHAAASVSSPTSPAHEPASTDMPQDQNLIGNIFRASMESSIYTPTDLRHDRSNLNASWYATAKLRQPVSGYFFPDVSDDDTYSTEDGWPCETYLLLSRAQRLLISWGTIDPQMKAYNFSADDDTIFPTRQIEEVRTVTANAAGGIKSGCFFDKQETNVSAMNSSWALATKATGFVYPQSLSSSLYPLTNLTSNITNCGISPFVNHTLANSVANKNISAYQAVAYSSYWAWANGEPRNITGSTSVIFRCALLDTNNNGRWRVEDCSRRYRTACRVGTSRYEWEFSSYSVDFNSASSNICPANTSFDIPRTALENRHLYSAMLNSKQDIDAVWVDFNSLDAQGCWVTGGANASCPYESDDTQLKDRTILVPTIAAIIVLIITALLLFVKCNKSRRASKRIKRRNNFGWDYEGVPS